MVSNLARAPAFSRASAQAVLEPEPPNHNQGLAHDVTGHLGMAFHTLGEDDGDLNDFVPVAPKPVGHFNLEAIAIRADIIQFDGLQGAAAEAFVTARGVGKGQSRDNVDVNPGAAAEHQPFQRPVHHTHTTGVTRAKHEVGILAFGRFEEFGDVLGVVRKIAVNFKNEFVAALQRPFEAGDVGAA